MNARFNGVVSGLDPGDALIKIELVWKAGAESEAEAAINGRGITWNAGVDDAEIAAFQASGQLVDIGTLDAGVVYTPAARFTESRGGAGAFTGAWTDGSAVNGPPTTPVISVTPGNQQNTIAKTSGGLLAQSYDIHWGTVSGTRSNVISGVTLPYVHTGRVNGTPYYYSLVAINAAGTAESSEVAGTPVLWNGYIEVDPNSHISVSGTRATLADIGRNESAYLYKDFGVDYFNANFSHQTTVYIDGTHTDNGEYDAWMLANDIGDRGTLVAANQSHLVVACYYADHLEIPYISLQEIDGSTTYLSQRAVSKNTPYWLTIRRDEAAGTYGTIYCDIYTNSGRTSLLATLSLALHTSKKDYRYHYAVNSYNDSHAWYISGYVEDISGL